MNNRVLPIVMVIIGSSMALGAQIHRASYESGFTEACSQASGRVFLDDGNKKCVILTEGGKQ